MLNRFVIIIGIIGVILLSSFIVFINLDLPDLFGMGPVGKDQLSFSEVMRYENIEYCGFLSSPVEQRVCRLKLTDCADDDCFFEKAHMELDETYCINITDDLRKVSCIASIERSKLLERTILSNNVSLCDDFQNEAYVQYCRDNFYIAKRFNMNDTSYCNNIKNEEIKKHCLE